MSTVTDTPIIAQILDAVEAAEPVIIVFKEGTPGDRAMYADVIVPRNNVLHADGEYRRVPDAEVESLAVMNRRGDWNHVYVSDVAAIQAV